MAMPPLGEESAIALSRPPMQQPNLALESDPARFESISVTIAAARSTIDRWRIPPAAKHGLVHPRGRTGFVSDKVSGALFALVSTGPSSVMSALSDEILRLAIPPDAVQLKCQSRRDSNSI